MPAPQLPTRAGAAVRHAADRIGDARRTSDDGRLPIVFAPVMAAEAAASVAVLAVRFGVWSVLEDRVEGERTAMPARLAHRLGPELAARLPHPSLPTGVRAPQLPAFPRPSLPAGIRPPHLPRPSLPAALSRAEPFPASMTVFAGRVGSTVSDLRHRR